MTIYVVRCTNQGNIAAVTSKKKALECVFEQGFANEDKQVDCDHVVIFEKDAFTSIRIDIF